MYHLHFGPHGHFICVPAMLALDGCQQTCLTSVEVIWPTWLFRASSLVGAFRGCSHLVQWSLLKLMSIHMPLPQASLFQWPSTLLPFRPLNRWSVHIYSNSGTVFLPPKQMTRYIILSSVCWADFLVTLNLWWIAAGPAWFLFVAFDNLDSDLQLEISYYLRVCHPSLSWFCFGCLALFSLVPSLPPIPLPTLKMLVLLRYVPLVHWSLTPYISSDGSSGLWVLYKIWSRNKNGAYTSAIPPTCLTLCRGLNPSNPQCNYFVSKDQMGQYCKVLRMKFATK